MTLTSIIFRLLGTIGVLAIYFAFVVTSRPLPWFPGSMPAQVVQQEQLGWIAFSIICACAGLGSVIAIWKIKD